MPNFKLMNENCNQLSLTGMTRINLQLEPNCHVKIFTPKSSPKIKDFANKKSISARELCIEKCSSVLSECLIECRGDISCTSGCNRQYAQCETTCPCGGLCFDGCPCSHFVQGFIQNLLRTCILNLTFWVQIFSWTAKTSQFWTKFVENVFQGIIANNLSLKTRVAAICSQELSHN